MTGRQRALPGMEPRRRRRDSVDACMCPRCGRWFPDVAAFDEHRKDER